MGLLWTSDCAGSGRDTQVKDLVLALIVREALLLLRSEAFKDESWTSVCPEPSHSCRFLSQVIGISGSSWAGPLVRIVLHQTKTRKRASER